MRLGFLNEIREKRNRVNREIKTETINIAATFGGEFKINSFCLF